jgi:hypothetical protein
LKAVDFFRTRSLEAEIILFEIYLSENSPYSGIICKDNWSFKPNEEEILLLPFFTFQVIDKQEK